MVSGEGERRRPRWDERSRPSFRADISPEHEVLAGAQPSNIRVETSDVPQWTSEHSRAEGQTAFARSSIA